MAEIIYSGNVSGSYSLNTTRTVSLSGSSVSYAVSTGVLLVRLYCSTNAYSRTYQLNASVGGYSGSTSFKFDSSNYTGAYIDITIYVSSSFDVNSISSMSVWDSSSYSDMVYIRNTQTVYAYYALPTNCGAPSTVTLAGSSSNAYALGNSTLTLAWSGASAGSYNSIVGYYVYKNGSLYQTISSSYTYGSIQITAPSSGNYDSYYIVTRGAVSGMNSGNSTSRTVYAYSNVSAPTSVSVSNEMPDAGTNVTLRWSGASSGGSYNPIHSYSIYRRSSPSAAWVNYASGVSSSGYSVPAPDTMGQTYYYGVATFGARGDTAMPVASAAVTAKVYTTDPPSNVQALPSPYVSGSGDINITWTAAICTSGSSIFSYMLDYRKRSFGGVYGEWTSLGSSGGTSYPCEIDYISLVQGDTVQFRVQAISDKWIFSDYTQSNEVYFAYTPVAPKSLTASPSVWAVGNNITLEWSAASVSGSSSISAYYVEYAKRTKSGSYGNWTALTNTSADVRTYTYTPTNLTAEGDHIKYRVRALSSHGVYSAYTEGNEVSRGVSPSAPTTFTAAPESYDSGDVTLDWSGAADEDVDIAFYEIQYASSTNGSAWSDWYNLKTVETSSGSGTTTDEPTMDRGSYRRYRIRTVDALGLVSSYAVSNTVYRVLGVIPPSALAPAGGVYETFGMVSWEASTTGDGQIAGYDVQTSDDGGASWSATTEQTALTFDMSSVFNALARGGSCCFRVRGRSTHGTVSDWVVSGIYQKNRLPATPSISLPSAGASVYSASPFLFVSVPAEPDAQQCILQVSKDGGDWLDVRGQLSGDVVIAYDAPGSATYAFRTKDALGAVGQSASISITASAYDYTDYVVEAGSTPIRAAHINELRTVTNSLRIYYGLDASAWSETVEKGTTSLRHFADHIAELRAALTDVAAKVNGMGTGTLVALPAWTDMSDFTPRASAIMELRSLCGVL